MLFKGPRRPLYVVRFLRHLIDYVYTKADLVQEVYKHHEGLTKAQAVESVEALLRISKDTLINGSDLLLSGFGKFNVRDKKSRK